MALLQDVPFPAIVITSGLVGHIFFNRLEPRSLPLIFSLLLLPPTALLFPFRSAYSNFASLLLVSYAGYIGALVASVVIYRLSPFHPLAEFPGPIPCKISRLWAWYIVQTGTQHQYYKSLHARYGTHVRTGPNHLFISDAEAIPAVLGAKGFPRGARYTATTLPGSKGSLLTMTDPREHPQRRRVWERSMNTSAIQGYQDLLAARIAQLVQALEERQAGVELSSWFSYFSFDFMGDLAFGGAFKLMEQGSDVGDYANLARLGVMYQELVGTIPWTRAFLWLVPSNGLASLRQFSKDSVLARKAQGTLRKDIFYYLLDEEGVGAGPPSLPTLIQESGLAIAAGSDTTGTALANIFFYLLAAPAARARLQAEVDRAFPRGADACAPAVAGALPFLNAVINEALRLQPAIPSGVQRVVPPDRGGALLAGRWVPAATTVQVPTYTVHRDPRYFSPDPEAFRPERWLAAEPANRTLNPAAFFPFSYGPMNCVGKNLALQELRMVVCALVQKFDFAFAAGWDPCAWEAAMQDYFLLLKGTLPVRVTVRG